MRLLSTLRSILIPALLLSGITLQHHVRAGDKDVVLFSDDFSRYPEGVLSKPFGDVNPAVQEYHYFAHRGIPLEPWGNAICYLDAWAGDRSNGKTGIRQVLTPTAPRMFQIMFAPLLVTGELEWKDYSVEANVTPLSTGGTSGIVLNYSTNRHFLQFSLKNGKEAHLAVRMPEEKAFRVIEWQELGTVDFPYESGKTYHLKVDVHDGKAIASINGKVVIVGENVQATSGKAGLVADVPTVFNDFEVRVTAETLSSIKSAIEQRERELAQLRSQYPHPVLWKEFSTRGFGAGRNVRFGDLDGDGQVDMLIGQNKLLAETNAATEISCLTAVNLDGKVLWQIGTPRPDIENALITCDTPFQIHDIDGDGANEVVLALDRKLQILDGRTGKVKKAVPVPEITSYPDVPQKPSKKWPTNVSSGDSIIFLDFSGIGRKNHIVMKDRYWNFWTFDQDLNLLWSGQGMLGHYPYAYRDSRTGKDLLAIGYALWNGEGKQLWTMDQNFKDHADSIAIGNFSGDSDEEPLAYYCGSDEGFIVADMRGFVKRHVRIGHAQASSVGKFRKDVPGLQIVADNFWKNPGVISVFQYDGTLLQQSEPMNSGSPLAPVNWCGDGVELILLSGNSREGGLLDGKLRRVVLFPDDGHPEMCAAVLNLTGDDRDEIILWDNERVAIYTQDRPFQGEKIYSPIRNPHENESNYRSHISLPNWKDLSKSKSR